MSISPKRKANLKDFPIRLETYLANTSQCETPKSNIRSQDLA